MANIIKPKRSNSAGVVPTTTNLTSGEIGVNMADKKIYINNGTAVVQVGAGNLTGLGDTNVTSPTNGQALTYNSTTGKWENTSAAGTGDVIGPASATDNAITRFDGTTGKLIQNSTATIDDNGNFGNVNAVTFDTTPATVPTTAGTMSWDDGDGVPSVLLKGGNTTLQVGTQEYARVYNDSGTTLTKGQVVYISGAQGNRIAVKLARADVEATSFGTIGLVAESIANGAEGYIIVSGALYKIDTTGLTAGATVYLSPTTAGAFTTTKPQAPNQLVVLGWVERVDNIVGSVYVKIDNGYELDELHDVQITSPQSGNLLIYDASTSPIGVWKNANLTDGTGISITEGAGSITIANSGVTSAVAGTGISVSGATGAVTITNSAPDQTVSLTAGSGISISGTYPSFTITNSSTSPIPAGTVMLFYQAAAPTGWTQVTTQNNAALRVVSGTGGGTGGTVAFTTAFASQSVAGTVSTTVNSTTATNQAATQGGTVSTSIANATQGGSVSTSIANATQGGSVSVTLASGGSVSGLTLATSQMPSHSHSWAAFTAWCGSGPHARVFSANNNEAGYSGDYVSVGSAGGDGSHSHGFTNPSYSGSFTGSAHNHTATSTFTGSAHNHTATSTFTGSSHNHTQDAHNHTASSSFSGTAINLAVQYIDVIICSKN